MLDLHTQEHGYTEISSPILVRDEVMFGTAQLPKFKDDQFSAYKEMMIAGRENRAVARLLKNLMERDAAKLWVEQKVDLSAGTARVMADIKFGAARGPLLADPHRRSAAYQSGA